MDIPGAERAVTPVAPARMLVDGVLRPAEGGREYPDVAPSTGEVFASSPDAGLADVDEAARAARRAFGGSTWRYDPAARADGSRRFLAAPEDDREVLRALLVREAGVPVRLTRSVLLDAVFAELASICDLLDRFRWRERLPDRSFHGFTSAREVLEEPVGVAALPTPANFPVTLLLRDLFLALAAGSTAVVKPSPHVPLVALEVARVAAESADLPPGVLNVVTGRDGAGLGCSSRGTSWWTSWASRGRRPPGARWRGPRPRSGSWRTWAGTARTSCWTTRTRTPSRRAARACFHAGQARTLFKRLLVPRDRFDDSVEAVRAAMASVPAGDPRDPGVAMGPVVSAELRDRGLALAAGVREAGGVVERGGRVTAAHPSGFFVEPTLVTGVPWTCSATSCPVRCWRCCPTTPKRRPWPSPTTPRTACPPRSAGRRSGPRPWPGGSGWAPSRSTTACPTGRTARTRGCAAAARRTRAARPRCATTS